MELYSGNINDDLAVVARNKLAETITGGLSAPGKMPEAAWGIPATRCLVGGVLAKQEGSVCSRCYALKGRYRMHHIQRKQAERLAGLEHPLWVPSMVLLIRWHVGRYFRWFDAGDLQSVTHLHNIALVAQHTPDIQHWLPTREYDIVRSISEQLPDNLVVRVSGHWIDGDVPDWWPTTSRVVTGAAPNNSWMCEALERGNHCGECRACWDTDVSDVAYKLH